MLATTPENLLRAYGRGLFPMAEGRRDPRMYWVDPETRGIIPLDGFHVPRRVARRVKQGVFEVRADTAFAAVIESCGEITPQRSDTWINDEIIALYCALFEMGHAHSVECWREGRLVGGLYGVSLGAAFFGESMFAREPDASKVALVDLVAKLRRGESRLLDTRFVTPHFEGFGAIGVRRARYHRMLRAALAAEGRFYPDESGASGAPDSSELEASGASRQSSTQMS